MHSDLDLWPFDFKIYRAHPWLMGSLHAKFHDDRCKGKAVMPRKPKCGWTDGRPDGRTWWFQYTPPYFFAGGIIIFAIILCVRIYELFPQILLNVTHPKSTAGMVHSSTVLIVGYISSVDFYSHPVLILHHVCATEQKTHKVRKITLDWSTDYKQQSA